MNGVPTIQFIPDCYPDPRLVSFADACRNAALYSHSNFTFSSNL